MTEHKNVFGMPLEICSTEPMTGFIREGSCKVTEDDIGIHGVCVQVTQESGNRRFIPINYHTHVGWKNQIDPLKMALNFPAPSPS